MKVWIAIEFNEDHCEILGVFSSPDLARSCSEERETIKLREFAKLNDRLQSYGKGDLAELPFSLSYRVDCWEIDGAPEDPMRGLPFPPDR